MDAGISASDSTDLVDEATLPINRYVQNIYQECDKIATSALPFGGEYHYYKVYPEFKSAVSDAKSKLREVATLCESAIRPRRPVPHPDWDEKFEVMEWLVGLLDDALEGVDTGLDEMQRQSQEGGPAEGALPSDVVPVRPLASATATRLGLHPKQQQSTSRPQDSFIEKVDNSNTPWVPRLARPEGRPVPKPGVHPYGAELESLAYPDWQLAPVTEPQAAPPLEGSEAVWVDTREALAQMVTEISGQREIAIDLEHHSYRSFQGITCLMQLSTRQRDYLVDVLVLRSEVGPALAGIFADSGVVKVLHGADSDIGWLQRDFGLYVVNMFDTGQAARILLYPSAGLAHLLERFCGIQADKRYQLADWRVRPLSEGMAHYARMDTHFLLYIYDCLRLELAQAEVPCAMEVPLTPGCPKTALGTVLERSRLICASLYQRELLTASSAAEMAARWQLVLSPVQSGVFNALYRWRDSVSRQEDESGGYVMPKAQLVLLAEKMPGTYNDLLAILGRQISEVVSRRAVEVVSVINEAKEEAARNAGPSIIATESTVASLLGPSHVRWNEDDAAVNTTQQTMPTLVPKKVAALKLVSSVTSGSASASQPRSAFGSVIGGTAAKISAKASSDLIGTSFVTLSRDATVSKLPSQPISVNGSEIGSLAEKVCTAAASPPIDISDSKQPEPLKPTKISPSVSAFGSMLGRSAVQIPKVGRVSLTPLAQPEAQIPGSTVRNTGDPSDQAGLLQQQQSEAATAAADGTAKSLGDVPRTSTPESGAVLAKGAANLDRNGGASTPESCAGVPESAANLDRNAEATTANAEIRTANAEIRTADVRGRSEALDQPGVAPHGSEMDIDDPASSREDEPGSVSVRTAAANAGRDDDAADEGRLEAGMRLSSTAMETEEGSALEPAAGLSKKRVAAMMTLSSSKDTAAAERVARLKSSFVLPFVSAPARVVEAIEQPGTSGAPVDDSEDGAAPGLVKRTAAEVRAVANSLRAEQGAEPSSMPSVYVSGHDMGVPELDFVPVPISEAFGDKRRSGATFTTDERIQSRPKKGLGFKESGGQDGGTSVSRSPVQPFDYSGSKFQDAGRASHSPSYKRSDAGGKDDFHGRGRGRGRQGGRGGRTNDGRGAGRNGQKPSGEKPSFRPYDIPDELMIKGGKRSAVAPRSGNRSFSFK